MSLQRNIEFFNLVFFLLFSEAKRIIFFKNLNEKKILKVAKTATGKCFKPTTMQDNPENVHNLNSEAISDTAETFIEIAEISSLFRIKVDEN